MIIACRSLTLRNKPLEVTLSAPTFNNGSWRCAYTIDWPNNARSYFGHGADSMQAIIIAMQMMAAELQASDAFKSGELYFEKPSEGLQLPLP